MEEDLRNLLDKIYELEGLVHLALKRPDSSGDLIRLIIKKGKDVGISCDEFASENKPDKLKEQSESYFNLEEYSLEDDKENSIKKDEDVIISQATPSKQGNIENKKGRLVFSINEKFRFRKELFNNSDADFNNTLALVASMDDYEEAEDFFINEEGFERNNPIVKEFLEVIKRYFL